MSGNISYQSIPSNVSVPGAYVEIDKTQNSQGTALSNNILVVGQKMSGGSATALVPVQVTSYAQAQTLFGAGSVLANMLKFIFLNNNTNSVWVVPQADDAGGTAAAGSIAFTATGLQAGTLSLYLGGVLVPVALTAGMTATQVGDAVEAAINAVTTLPVTAVNTTGTVAITFNHKGLVGNSYDMRLNYQGALAGEVTPTGLTVAFTQLTGGATNPDVTDAFAVLPNVIYSYMVFAYTDSTNLAAIEAAIADRWLPTQMLEGHAFVGVAGTTSTVATAAGARNSQHLSMVDCGYLSPTPPWQRVCAVVGQVALAADADPARPFTGLPLNGVLAEALENQRVWQDQQTLLDAGAATCMVTKAGGVTIQRLTTTYKTDTLGNTDKTYKDANTVLLLSAIRQDLVSTISGQFNRYKLADDGVVIPANQATVTPSTIKSIIIGRGMVWLGNNWIQNFDDFKNTLVVQRNVSDRTRVDCVLKPTLINQLQVVAAAIQFSI